MPRVLPTRPRVLFDQPSDSTYKLRVQRPWQRCQSGRRRPVLFAVVELSSKPRLKPRDCQPSSLRIHGYVFLSYGRRRIEASGSRDWDVAVTDPIVRALDHRVEVVDPAAVFTSHDALRELIHGLLAEAPLIGGFDLTADNWEGDFVPDGLATSIVVRVRRQTDDDGGVVPCFDLDIEIPQLWLCLLYSEPKALLLACKEAAAMAAQTEFAQARAPGELCPICLLELETGDEEAVRLPCSHAFHTMCIVSWFYRGSMCPNCRHDIMECFSFVRSLWLQEFVNLGELFLNYMAEGEQFINPETEDEQFLNYMGHEQLTDHDDLFINYIADEHFTNPEDEQFMDTTEDEDEQFIHLVVAEDFSVM